MNNSKKEYKNNSNRKSYRFWLDRCFFPTILFVLWFLTPALLANNSQQNDIQRALTTFSLPLSNQVNKVYASRNYTLIWSDGSQFNDKAHALFNVIKSARKIGLNPADYDLDVIKYFIESTIDDSYLLSKSDITFTHAYIKLASHIENKASIIDLPNEYALFKNDTFLSDAYKQPIALDPPANKPAAKKLILQNQDHYTRLLSALETYRSVSNETDPIALPKKSLAIGDVSPEIVKARNKLHGLGDYKNTDLSNDTFDEELALAISHFQHRHGLETDGVLGKRTVREINKSGQDRAIQLEVNLERAKQISAYGNSRYILVNVPEYKLYVIENGQTIYQTRVVVGKKKHKTPVITSEISEFVLNPYWNVPKSITKNEIIPKIQEDPNYLANNDMKIISRQNNRNIVVDPEYIDWSTIDPYEAPIRIRQDPGNKNALGRVKFIFPNNHRVYLHDTPSRRLFARNSRAFSHGCVRVENPIEFAEVLLSNSTTWTNEDLHYFADRDKTKVIKLDSPIPIHITYMTAWADEQGVIHFRPDIYKRDSHIASTLYNDPQ